MNIFGVQKLTLLDYPNKTAATVFLSGCNFRCQFCHNASLINDTDNAGGLEADEVLSFLKTRINLLDGVCISGGEPLLYNDIENFISQIKELGFSVKLDTNGQLHERLKSIINNKLVDYIAMDIKNSLKNYGTTIGIPNFDTANIEKSADLLTSGSLPYEFRTTVVRELHNTDDFHLIGKRFKGAKKYFLQYFKDTGDVLIPNLSAYNEDEMQKLLDILTAYIPSAALR